MLQRGKMHARVEDHHPPRPPSPALPLAPSAGAGDEAPEQGQTARRPSLVPLLPAGRPPALPPVIYVLYVSPFAYFFDDGYVRRVPCIFGAICCTVVATVIATTFFSPSSPTFSTGPIQNPPPITVLGVFTPYQTQCTLQPVLDLRQGGELNIVVGNTSHAWGLPSVSYGNVYGFGAIGRNVTFLGPTILVSRNVAVNITWTNRLSTHHLFPADIDSSQLDSATKCYPKCGVPVRIRVEGSAMLSREEYVYEGESKKISYSNAQEGGVLVYHDFASGLGCFSTWAGLIGAYVIEDAGRSIAPTHSTPPLPPPPLLTHTLNPFIGVGAALTPEYVFHITDYQMGTHSGRLSYPSPCPVDSNSDPLGELLLVNGKAAPFIQFPRKTMNMCFLNAGTIQRLVLHFPFAHVCQVFSVDSTYVHSPFHLPNDTIALSPLQRVQLACDFTNVIGNVFNVTALQHPNELTLVTGVHVLQVRVDSIASGESIALPSEIRPLHDLQQVWRERNDSSLLTKSIRVSLEPSLRSCENAALGFDPPGGNSNLTCFSGAVEKWTLFNNSPIEQLFYWQSVHVQCGDQTASNANTMVDLASIPPFSECVCYVACGRSNGSHILPVPGEAVVIGFNLLERGDQALPMYLHLV